MDIQIDTDGLNSNAALRHEFGVEGMASVTVRYGRTSKKILKIIISDTPVTVTDRFFHQLAHMVSDAVLVRELAEKNKDTSDKYKTMIEMAKGSKVNVTC